MMLHRTRVRLRRAFLAILWLVCLAWNLSFLADVGYNWCGPIVDDTMDDWSVSLNRGKLMFRDVRHFGPPEALAHASSFAGWHFRRPVPVSFGKAVRLAGPAVSGAL